MAFSLEVDHQAWKETEIRRLTNQYRITGPPSLRPSPLSSRHLQIVAGMERFEYVVVYWILITETEAILKKKVPKIATGSF